MMRRQAGGWDGVMISGDGTDDGSEASKAGSDWDMERERDRGRQAPRRDDMPGRYRLDDETTDDIMAMTRRRRR